MERWTVTHSGRHLLEGRQAVARLIPTRGTAYIDVHPQLEDFEIVEAGSAQENHAWHTGIDREHSGAACCAEMTRDDVPRVCGAFVCSGFTTDRYAIFWDGHMRAMPGPARAAAIVAMTMPHHGLDGLSLIYKAFWPAVCPVCSMLLEGARPAIIPVCTKRANWEY
jgi:hypothetical protein